MTRRALAPVSIATLRDGGPFDDAEACDPDCPIHGTDADAIMGDRDVDADDDAEIERARGIDL